jgi:hypothetical protein
MITITESILAINPNAKVSVTDNDVNKILWLENTEVINSSTILAKQNELQAEEINKEIIKEQNKQSALTKLSTLGLTEAEIKAILG